jgi:hypothetical protein
MSDTPEFDALLQSVALDATYADSVEEVYPIAKFARRMERERNAARNAVYALGVKIAEKRLIGYREFGTRLAAAERERDAYKEAYEVARPAILQSHNGHFDRTGGSGSGCPECIRAREAARKCKQILAKLGVTEIA